MEIDPTSGRARGIELVAESRNGSRFGWSASYALARSEELVDGRWVPVEHDQTQTFYADVSYIPAPQLATQAARGSIIPAGRPPTSATP